MEYMYVRMYITIDSQADIKGVNSVKMRSVTVRETAEMHWCLWCNITSAMGAGAFIPAPQETK